MNTAIAPVNRDLILAGPVGSLDAYMTAVHGIPVLSAAEERDLALRFRQDGDLDAARHLVLSQLRFVVHIARGYTGYGLPLGDLIQEGNLGLMKAVKRFDPEVGVRLVSFAVHWIRAEIHEFVLKNWRLVKVATTKAQRKLFFNLRKSKKHLGWLSGTETDAIAKDLGVSAQEVTEMEKRLASYDLAYDPEPGADDESAYAPAHYLKSDDADPAEAIENNDWQQQTYDRLSAALKLIDDRSREILEARWLAEKKTTLQDLANHFGISAERVRQIENQAIKTLRSHLA
jgi:RNA polymerase sigma-32 factor